MMMTKMSFVRGCVTIWVGIWLAGCGKNEQLEPGVYVGETSKAIAEMVPEDVIVKVNGTAFTRADYELLLGGLEKIRKINQPSVNPLLDESTKARRGRTLPEEFIVLEILLGEARRRGITPDSKHKVNAERPLLGIAKKHGTTVDGLKTSADSELRAVFLNVQNKAMVFALQEAEFGDKLEVTDEDVAKIRQRFDDYNAMSKATNQLVFARGKAICERVRGGEDFFTIAREMSEEYEDSDVKDGVWGEFMRGEFDNAAVADAVFSLPVGGISDPIDTDEGLMIIKVIERTGSDSAVAIEAATAKVGRILLRLVEDMENVENEAVLRNRISRAKIERIITPWVAQLREKARIEYPNGTNFFQVAKGSKSKRQ